MAFVSDVESDENGRDLLNNAGILKSSAVQSANSGNFARQFANPLSSVLVIAADDYVTIDWAILLEKVSGQIMKRCDHDHTFRHEFRRLLCSRALPDAESADGLAANACRQRDGGVYKDLSGPQRRLDVLQGRGLRFKGNGENTNLRITASKSVFSSRSLLLASHFFGELTRGFQGALRVTRADNDCLARLRESQCQPRTFRPGTSDNGNGHANSGSSSGSAGKLSNISLI